MTVTPVAIGVDVGGTKIEAGRIDLSGNVLQQLRLPTNTLGGPEATEKQIIESIRTLLEFSDAPVSGIGIGIAGQIDALTGVVRFSPNLPNWHDVPLRAILEKAFGLPVKIVNDVRAITWGEWLFGAGKGFQDLVCVFVGTGIGSGVVIGGKLLEGHSNSLGEVGHMSIDFNGPLCTCGSRGCWEAIAGGWGIAKYAQEKVASHPDQGACMLKLADHDPNRITAKIVVEAYRLNDPLAMLILERVKIALITGCVNLVNIYNPQCLILGGGFLDGVPELIPLIEAGVRRLALKIATESLVIVPAKLGKQVGVIGAAAIVLKLSNE